MSSMALASDPSWVPTALDLGNGSEEGCFVLLAVWVWLHGRRSVPHRWLIVSSLVVAHAFEILATGWLHILTHNPPSCRWWHIPTVPTAVVLSWCVGILSHMQLAGRIQGMAWWETAALDVVLLALMDIMTEVAGIAHNCWAWSPAEFVSAAPRVASMVPNLLADTWWGVPVVQYNMILGVVLLHSLVMRWLLRPTATFSTFTKACVVASLPVVTLLWIAVCMAMHVAVGDRAFGTALVAGCLFAALRPWVRGVASVGPSPGLATAMTLGGCYFLNTSRLFTLPAWTTAQAVCQTACIAVAMGVMLWPASAPKPKDKLQ